MVIVLLLLLFVHYYCLITLRPDNHIQIESCNFLFHSTVIQLFFYNYFSLVIIKLSFQMNIFPSFLLR
jgi:hypothetical protein